VVHVDDSVEILHVSVMHQRLGAEEPNEMTKSLRGRSRITI
jgi:hypothetical protein